MLPHNLPDTGLVEGLEILLSGFRDLTSGRVHVRLADREPGHRHEDARRLYSLHRYLSLGPRVLGKGITVFIFFFAPASV